MANREATRATSVGDATVGGTLPPADGPDVTIRFPDVTMVVMDPERVAFEGFEGLRLVADVRGDPDACPVLFLHGGGQTRHAWGSTAETVAAQGWRTVALDLRGHGDSDWAANGDYSFTAFCADCVAVADQLGRPPVLVGASLGGMAAMLAEGTSDRTVSCGLVLVDITPKTNPEGIQRIRTFMQSRRRRLRLAGGRRPPPSPPTRPTGPARSTRRD